MILQELWPEMQPSLNSDKGSLELSSPWNDRLHYLRLIGAYITAFETNKFEEKQKKKEERDKEAAKVAEMFLVSRSLDCVPRITESEIQIMPASK